jgi:ParB family chromosome partitioning protein
MKVVDIQIERLCEAPWNANHMDDNMLQHLVESLKTYGILSPLVVRTAKDSYHEVLSGNQRLRAIKCIGFASAPCVIVDLNDGEAMLLAQALNAIKGQDDISLKGSLLKTIISSVPEKKILSLLPETTESLIALSTMDQSDLARHLQAWTKAQDARLKHLQLQLTGQQLGVVEQAISLVMDQASNDSFGNPNYRSNAVYLLCQYYLEAIVKRE